MTDTAPETPPTQTPPTQPQAAPNQTQPARPHIAIHYCTGCNWLLRAGWMAQEVLSTFGEDLGAVTLIPGHGGIFEIRLDGALIWERKRDGGFPDARQLKQILRDQIDPGRDLGHLDRAAAIPATPA